MLLKKSAVVVCAVMVFSICGVVVANGQVAGQEPVRSRLVQRVNENNRVTLQGHVRRDLTTENDLGLVEDGLQMHLTLSLKRTAAQQAALDNLLARQQQPTAAEYHKWLTPKEFGALLRLAGGHCDSDDVAPGTRLSGAWGIEQRQHD